MIFIIEKLDMQVLIWNYLQFLRIKKIALQQLQGGLCNEFDSSSFELKFSGSTFQCANKKFS